MPSVIALRALLGAGLGLGALDLVWINAALAPQLVGHESVPRVTVASVAAEPHEEPAPEVPAVPPAKPDEPVTMRVYFDTGSAVIDVRARKVLEQIAERGPAIDIALEGHADPRGPEALNDTLSKDRAVAVQQQLVRFGIAAARIHVGYVGERDATDVLWRDRRVDIQITGGSR